MTSRPAAHVVRRHPAPPGEHPNKFLPWVTCDFRVFWTPETDHFKLVRAVNSSLLDLYDLIEMRHAQTHVDRGRR